MEKTSKTEEQIYIEMALEIFDFVDYIIEKAETDEDLKKEIEIFKKVKAKANSNSSKKGKSQ